MWNKIKEIIGQYLSIEESRKSIVILVLIGISTMGLYKAYYGIDIPSNLMTGIITLSGYVFGINTVNSLGGIYNNYVNGKGSMMNVENISLENKATDNDINGSI